MTMTKIEIENGQVLHITHYGSTISINVYVDDKGELKSIEAKR